jgi:hypothetical protein
MDFHSDQLAKAPEAAEDEGEGYSPNRQQTGRAFDPFWLPRTEHALRLVQKILSGLDNYEGVNALRKRKRKRADRERWEELIAALVSDLARQALIDDEQPICLSLSKRNLNRQSRYKSPIIGKALPRAVELLQAAGLMRVEKGYSEFVETDQSTYWSKTPTMVFAGSLFRALVKEHRISLLDFCRSEREEIIILRSAKKANNVTPGPDVEYQDTEETERWRRELWEINRWLEEARLSIGESVYKLSVDTSIRRLRRIFNNGSFRQGGRLYGGFWQDMPKDARKRHLQIEGESVSEIDYKQVSMRLLYALAGMPPPSEDIYDFSKDGYGREGVKACPPSATMRQLGANLRGGF